MDTTQRVATLATVLVPVLPYLLKKAGEKAADGAIKKVGKSTWDFAKVIWSHLWPKVQAKEAAREAAEDVAGNPGNEDALASLRHQLAKLLSEDHALADEIARLLEEGRKAGVVVVAAGERSMAVGHDANGIFVSGDRNTVGGGK